jgi:hypothetical protein
MILLSLILANVASAYLGWRAHARFRPPPPPTPSLRIPQGTSVHIQCTGPVEILPNFAHVEGELTITYEKEPTPS